MTQHQPYDHALKSLMGDHAAEIIPQLLSDTEVIREQNVEIKREMLRADLVYLVKYRGEAHTLNLELQTNADENMALRMLRYHVELLIAYRLPVLSVVLYLFEANIPESPFRETSGSAKEEDYMEYHYDSLLDEDPEVKERVARGKVEALQEMAMEVVNDQYPTLAELAQERVLLIKQPEMLRQLVKQIYKAPDESTARWVLNTFAA